MQLWEYGKDAPHPLGISVVPCSRVSPIPVFKASEFTECRDAVLMSGDGFLKPFQFGSKDWRDRRREYLDFSGVCKCSEDRLSPSAF